MRFSRPVADIATFALAALLVYVVGATLLGAWPMWAMMWAMMGWGMLRFWSGSILALLAVTLVAGLAWLIGRGSWPGAAGTDDSAERCPQCRAPIAPDYILCPECHTALQSSCPECRRPLKAHWTACPYCGVDSRGVAGGANFEQHYTEEVGDNRRQ